MVHIKGIRPNRIQRKRKAPTMLKFTIEATYLLPVYRHKTYEASDLAAAVEAALLDDNWDSAKMDYDSSRATFISGAWTGEEAYCGDALPIPAEHGHPSLDDFKRALADYDCAVGAVSRSDTERTRKALFALFQRATS